MKTLERAILWTGGAVFVGALLYCGYTFVAVWNRPAPFDASAIWIDAALFAAFAAHHSVFARDPVKRGLAHVVPERLLRSIYVWAASLLLVAVCAAWQPVGGEIYHARGWPAMALAAVQVAGVLTIASAVRAIDALDLAGIRPHATADALQFRGPYRWVRHPLYLGWLLATFGPAHMTGDRLMFAGISLFYLLIAMPFEERSLVASFGEPYLRYRQLVRWRIVPYVY